MRAVPVLCAFALAFLGCGTDYCWRPSVPERLRTVSVPTFRNESEVPELGVIASRQILREFQREGTFALRTGGDAAIEIQGVIKSAPTALSAYDRRTGSRIATYDFSAVAEVSVIDKTSGRVVIDNRRYDVQTSVTSGQDLSTARRDASGRLMDELSRHVVDDVLSIRW